MVRCSVAAAAMVAVEFLEVSSNTITKAVMARGLSTFIFVVYSSGVATIVLLLSSSVYYRKRCAPPLTISIFLRICILGFVSGSLQLLMNFGIRYSSPTLASVMTNLVPAFTYLLATVSRMEKLNLKMRSNQAKALGTLISVAGAIIVTLYKGLPLTFFSTQSYSLHRRLQLSPSEWVLGGLLLSLGCFFKSLLYIVQTWIIRDYPEELLVTTISYTVSTIQSSIVCLVAERNSSTWRLSIGWDLFAVIYSGVLVHTLRALVHTWVCRTNGPVYTAMYQPLGLIIATVLGVSFLKDALYLGSLFGAAVILLGFYSVMWGQAKQHETGEDNALVCCFTDSARCEAPLLQGGNMQT